MMAFDGTESLILMIMMAVVVETINVQRLLWYNLMMKIGCAYPCSRELESLSIFKYWCEDLETLH